MRYMLMLLVLGGWCWGATFYVDNASPAGGDGTTTETSGTDPHRAFHQIMAACNSASVVDGSTISVAAGNYNEDTTAYLYFNTDTNGKTLTITNGSATHPVVTTANTEFCVRINTGMATGHIIFDGIDFAPATAGNALDYSMFYLGASVPSLTIKNSVITIPTSATGGLFSCTALAAPTRDITFENCTITAPKIAAAVIDVDNFIVKNCTITDGGTANSFTFTGTNGITNIEFDTVTLSGSEGHCFSIAAGTTGITKIYIHGGSYTTDANSNGFGFFTAASAATFSNIIIDGATWNTGKGCIQISMSAGNVWLNNNKCTSTHATAAGIPIQVGADAGTNANPLSNVIVTNNVCKFGGADNTHALLIGAGCDKAEVSGNLCIGGDIQLVLKSSGGNVHHNTTYGDRGIYLKGATFYRVWNNTAKCTSGGAFEWGADEVPTAASKNYIVNNVFDGTSGDAAIKDLAGTEQSNLFDYNCYVAGTHLAIIGGENFDTLATLKAKWLAFSTFGALNDAHSIVANPSLDGNYQARGGALKNAGSPLLVKSDGTVLLRNDIGATKFSGSGSGGLFGGGGLFGN